MNAQPAPLDLHAATLEDQRAAFSLPRDVHYLNCAYMSPLSERVVAAGIEGIRRKCDPSTITPRHFFEEVDQVRSLFARLVHADDPNAIAMIPSVSYGMAIVARNAEVESGQNVVTVHHQFPANVYPWKRLCSEVGATLRVINPPEADDVNRAASWNAAICESIDSQTALVALPHVHWTDGTIFDLETIGARARHVGAVLVVDGTQSVGALDFDVNRVKPDALVCAAYKWLMGPYATGCAFIGPRFQGGVPIEETWIGREGSENFSGLVDYSDAYRPGAIRFDVGENSNFTLIPMLKVALEQVLGWGVSAIYDYCDRLTKGLIASVRNKGYAVAEESGRARHMFGIRMKRDIDVLNLKKQLEEKKVFVSLRGDAIRIAPHVYNTPEDVAALDALL